MRDTDEVETFIKTRKRPAREPKDEAHYEITDYVVQDSAVVDRIRLLHRHVDAGVGIDGSGLERGGDRHDLHR